MNPKQRQTKNKLTRGEKEKFTTKDGRTIVYVRYPCNWTIRRIEEKLFWAKSWKVDELFDGVIIRCYVKPQYVKHFLKENKHLILPYSYSGGELPYFSVQLAKDTENIYLE